MRERSVRSGIIVSVSDDSDTPETKVRSVQMSVVRQEVKYWLHQVYLSARYHPVSGEEQKVAKQAVAG